jgi:tetratricopeptide (TPR) repeat protein
MQRAVRNLKSGDLKHARKQLEQALKIAPDNPDINFFLGYIEFTQQDYAQAQAFLVKAVTRDSRNVQALTLLGRVRLLRGDYSAASATLDEAVLADPDSWTAHKFLAEASLREHNFEKARDHAQLALSKGKGAANSARLTLGQALASLGKTQEAISVLDAFLRETQDKGDAEKVRDYISELKLRPNQPKDAASTTLLQAVSGTDDVDFRLSIKTWEPPGVDESKPPIVSDVACPTDDVLSRTGLKVKQLVSDIGRFAAIEELQHERVDELGHATSKDTRHYNYVASISESTPGYLEVDEYRLEHSALAQYPDGISSSGFTTLAFVFHPDMQPTFEFACEGLGEWRGKSTWLVHFRQRADQPNRTHDIKIGGMIYPIDLKGRAWIAVDSFQIVHMESQLIKPLKTIQLLTEHQIVDYGPVQFKNEQLWLPSRAELYFDFRKHRYHRTHTFSRFMLFSTSTQEAVQEPKRKTGVAPSVPENQ